MCVVRTRDRAENLSCDVTRDRWCWCVCVCARMCVRACRRACRRAGVHACVLVCLQVLKLDVLRPVDGRMCKREQRTNAHDNPEWRCRD